MMYINGEEIVEVVYEWGTRWPDTSKITPMDSEQDARVIAEDVGGIPLVKTIYVTDWMEIQPIGAKSLCSP